jgi:hypothetical protein
MLQWDTTARGINVLQSSDLMKQCYSWFCFTNEEIIDSFNHRDKSQTITIAPDAEWMLFAQRTTFKHRPSNTVAFATRSGNTLNLQFAIRIPFRLHDEMDLLTPFEMLQLLVEAYGLQITIGSVTAGLIIQHSFDVPAGVNPASLFQVHNPDNHSFLVSSLVKINPGQAGLVADCRLVFALDCTRLLSDLA